MYGKLCNCKLLRRKTRSQGFKHIVGSCTYADGNRRLDLGKRCISVFLSFLGDGLPRRLFFLSPKDRLLYNLSSKGVSAMWNCTCKLGPHSKTSGVLYTGKGFSSSSVECRRIITDYALVMPSSCGDINSRGCEIGQRPYICHDNAKSKSRALCETIADALKYRADSQT